MQRVRSDWSQGIFRQSSDEKMTVNRQTYDGGGNGRTQFSSGSDDSCQRLAHASNIIRCDSDSDSDPKKWTKNPLVVRRVKRSDKLRQAEKRFSGTDNVFSSGNRDSFVPRDNEENRQRTASVSVKNTGSKDEGSGSRPSSKYQKLEQMRKMRLNLSVTSDEENVPQKPQPHRWSGSNIRNFAGTHKDTEPLAHQGMVRSQFGQEFHKTVNSQPSLPPQVHVPATHNTQPLLTSSVLHLKQPVQPSLAKTPMPYASTGLGIQPSNVAPSQTTHRLNNSQTQFSGYFPEPQVPSSRQTFHPLSHIAGPENSSFKITEINSSRSNPAFFGNSSNFTANRLTSQVSAPSFNPAADYKTMATISHPMVVSQDTTYLKSKQVPPPDRTQSASVLRPSSYTTPGPETKRTTTNISNSKCPQKIPRKIMSRPGMLEGHDDSLDELVESNIQYLSSDVDKAKPKRSSSNSVIKFSSLPDHGKITGRVLSNTAPQTQPSIQVQANTSIQVHVTLPVDPPRFGTSLVRLAPSADSDYHPSYSFSNQLTSQPDLIPKNFPQNVYSPLSQTRNNDYNRPNMGKTADQIGGRAAFSSQPGFGTVQTRMGFADKKPRSDTEISLHAPKVDKGMFSDVEYDIEVSERVKKWETMLKVREPGPTSDKKDMGTIREHLDADCDMRKALVPSKQSHFLSSYADDVNQANAPRVISIETNARRFFQVIPDARLNIQAQGVSNRLFPTPLALRPEKTFTSASELRQQVLASRVHPLPVTAGPAQVTYKPPVPADSGQEISTYRDTSFSGQHVSPYRDMTYSGQHVSPYRDMTYSGQHVSPYRDMTYGGQTVSPYRDSSYSGQQVSPFRESSNRGQPVSLQRDTSYSGKPVSSSRGTSYSGQPVSSQKDTSYSGQPVSSPRGTSYSGQPVSSPRGTSYSGQPVSSQTDTSYSGQPVSSSRGTSYSGQPVSSQTDTSYSGQPVSSQKDTSVVRRISNKDDVGDLEKRGSKYREELNEISYMKSDSVGNLRRRFDTDSTNATSEDDKKSVSTASAKLSLPSKEYSSKKESPDWSQVLPSYQTSLRDSEVWSPNLESTQGVPVSIERVTARTLQTIPFSDDPFWKEIEQMTTFDPTSREAMLTAAPIRSHHQVQLIPQQSFTLPTQPHRNVTSVVDKLQKSKSLYTPNIAPLTVDVGSRSSSNAATALDGVLNDISRSPRKPLSPKKRSLDIDSSPTNMSTSDTSRFLKTRPNSDQFGKSEYSQLMFKNSGDGGKAVSARTLESGLRGFNRLDLSTTQQQQPLQFSELPRQHLQPNTHNRQSQNTQGFMNNYQLDVNLLKQKLINTGLVEADAVETDYRGHYQSPSLDRPAHDNMTTRSNTAQPFSRVASKLNSDAGLKGPPVLTSSQPLNKSNISITNKTIFITQPHKQPGSRTLDEIQKALAPFNTANYKPDAETLYGVSKLQAFNDAGCDTSIGSHTSATGWSYHTQPNTEMERSNTVDSSLSAGSSRLQEVNESMDDLTNLARGVELRINEIKNKLQSADETSLDQILLSLRKLTPEVRLQETDTAHFEDYYENKKSKLSDALSELDRIYTSLELNINTVNTVHKPEKPPSDLSSSSVRGPQPKSVHLRPMQTRISSVFIRDQDANKMSENEEKESEFDVISKSFQAIVDEVNQTTDLLSRAVERSRQDNTAPETQKLVSKSTVKPGSFGKEHQTAATSTARADTAAGVQNSANTMLNTAKQPTSELTNTSSSPSSSTQQIRFRPVKDNKIVQEDKVTKRDSEERMFKSMPSPKPSPTLRRKLPCGDQESETKPNFVSHDALAKQTLEVKRIPLQINVKEQTVHAEGLDANKSMEPVKPSLENKTMSSVGSNLTESPLPDSNVGITASDSLPLASKSDVGRLSAALQTTIVSMPTDGNFADTGLPLPSTASTTTVSAIFVPSVTTSKVSKHLLAGTTSDQSESASKNGNKPKRQVASGVAMMLGRFSSSQESIDGSKKGTSTPAGIKDDPGEENMEDVFVEAPPTDTTEGKVTSEGNLKGPVRSSPKGKQIHTFDVKSTALSYLERKLVDPETKLLNSGASSPQPSSSVNKPPQSPWKRHTSDPERQSVADAIKAYSPKFVSKIPRPASSNGSTASDGYFTPKELDSPSQVVGSPGVTTSKERPPVWKSPVISPRARGGRPHSFHELISVFEKETPNKLNTLDKFRKCASADEVSSNDTLVGKGFRCEQTVPEETATEKRP